MVFFTIPEILDNVFDFFDLADCAPLRFPFDLAPMPSEVEEEDDGLLVAEDVSVVGRERAGKAPGSEVGGRPPC